MTELASRLLVISARDSKVDLQTFKEAVSGALKKTKGLPIWKLMGMKAGLLERGEELVP